jgi:ABC-type multidrug transport system fused ATPase/permease subunit
MTKITPDHLARSTFVYIRQSAANQALNNHEIRRRQYGLEERVRQLGWRDVVVIDDNLGRSLSGGQRQRLSIARAVIRDPKIALFDEPTAFLDAEAAIALEKKLESWGRDRLLILATHHLAAARNADRILVLEAGRLVGDGAHEQLLATAPHYASLWSDYARSLTTRRRGEVTPFLRRAAAPRRWFS